MMALHAVKVQMKTQSNLGRGRALLVAVAAALVSSNVPYTMNQKLNVRNLLFSLLLAISSCT
jgi:hypothetical protein